MQRKTAIHEFKTKSLRSFVVERVQSEIQNRLLPVLTNASKIGNFLDLQDILQRFAFDNICSVAFGGEPACHLLSMPTSPLEKAFDDATEISVGRFYSAVPFLWRLKHFLNSGPEKRLREAIKVVDEFAMDMVSCRRKGISENRGLPEREDLLSRFIVALSTNTNELEGGSYWESDKKSSGTTDTFLKEMVVSFMLAGGIPHPLLSHGFSGCSVPTGWSRKPFAQKSYTFWRSDHNPHQLVKKGLLSALKN